MKRLFFVAALACGLTPLLASTSCSSGKPNCDELCSCVPQACVNGKPGGSDLSDSQCKQTLDMSRANPAFHCTNGGADGSATDTGTMQDAGDSGAGNDSGGGSFYCPAGTMLTPYISATRKTSFTMAGQVLAMNADYFAVLETDVGRIVLDLTEALTPITVNSFVFLTLNHFYDGVAFHRVIDMFVAQGGDPNTVGGPPASWGTGGPGYMFNTELVMSLNFDSRGVLGMARAQSMGSNGSQFFITLAPTPNLDQMYTVFGKVTEGDAVLDMIVRGMPPNFTNPTRMKTVNICQK
jgi:peptidylprolyl isomerase